MSKPLNSPHQNIIKEKIDLKDRGNKNFLKSTQSQDKGVLSFSSGGTVTYYGIGLVVTPY